MVIGKRTMVKAKTALEILQSDPIPKQPAEAVLPLPVYRSPFTVRRLGLQDYELVLRQMKAFTLKRDASTPDEFWHVEHPRVYTLGVSAKPEQLPRPDNGFPVLK